MLRRDFLAGMAAFAASPLAYLMRRPAPPQINRAGLYEAVSTLTPAEAATNPIGFMETVNAAPFFGAPPGTVRLSSVTLTAEAGADGSRSWRRSSLLWFKPEGWNNFPGPDGRFRQVTDRFGRPVYPSADFRFLNLDDESRLESLAFLPGEGREIVVAGRRVRAAETA